MVDNRSQNPNKITFIGNDTEEQSRTTCKIIHLINTTQALKNEKQKFGRKAGE